MLKEAIVHIGMHKTGSSAIQRALKNYDDGETYFARLGFENHSGTFYIAFATDYANYHHLQARGVGAEEAARMRLKLRELIEKEIQKPGRTRIIFSGEGMSFLDAAGVHELHNFLSQYSEKQKIICYVREPLSFAASAFQQKCRHGFNEMPGVISPEYKNKLEKFRVAFGHENMVVRDCDRKILVGNDIVADFVDITGLSKDMITPGNANESMSQDALKLIYHFNTNCPVIQGDMLTLQAATMLRNMIEMAYRDAGKPDKALFTGLADYSELDYLNSCYGITFSTVRPEAAGDNAKFYEWLNSIGGVNLIPIQKLLAKCGINGNYLKPLQLLVRLYYYCLCMAARQDSDLAVLLNPGDVDVLKNVALKYENKQGVTREEAIALMSLAARVSPGPARMQQKINMWREGN